MSLPRIPRDPENDYTREAAAKRRALVREQTGAELEHVSSFSFDPAVLPGNIENFIGVAQMPIGLAGPLLVDGEHAQGEFYVPMATTEGGRSFRSYAASLPATKIGRRTHHIH